MVIETTHSNKAYKELVNDTLGKSFSLYKSFKIGGIGSKRMIVDEVSLKFKHLIDMVSDINYANIELRPKGIIVHIDQGLKKYKWIIPYYQLVIYKTNGLSIHSQGNFIHFKNNKSYQENKQFLDKLFELKIKNTINHSLN